MPPPRKLTDEDVAAIVNALLEREGHCRYDVTPDEMKEIKDFVKTFNEAMTRSRNAFIDWLVKMTTGVIFYLLVSGKLYSLIQSWVAQ